MNQSEAAQLLGMRESEIDDVADASEGTVITTTDGVRTVLVPDDRPDGDGKTGLMLLEKPQESRVYTAPVYTPHDVDEADEIAQPSPRAKRSKKAVAEEPPVAADAPEPAADAAGEPTA